MTANAVPGSAEQQARVTLTGEAYARLVRQVGRSAASTFLMVGLGAHKDERGVLVSRVSARRLARDLKIAQDTASPHLPAPARPGQPRAGGRFACAEYVVRLPDGVKVTPGDGAPSVAPAPAHVTPRRSPRPSPMRDPARLPVTDPAAQLDLFPGPGSSDTTPAR
ncbi:MAG: hypothetical protein HYU28_10330 [Actinobacteria bacterium]|nr:hypothetical protein [Actinomycetota bacterium]